MWILGCRAVQVNKLKCVVSYHIRSVLACGFTLPPGKFHKAACARLTIPESGSETSVGSQRSVIRLQPQDKLLIQFSRWMMMPLCGVISESLESEDSRR